MRFALVGGLGVGVNYGVFLFGLHVVFKSLGEDPLRDHFAVILGIAVSIFTNFILNDFWTWGDRRKVPDARPWPQRLLFYYVFASVAGVTNWAVDFLLYDWVFSVDIYIAHAVGISTGILINFYFNDRWTYRDSTASLPAARNENGPAGEDADAGPIGRG
jgi:dolichol-phosphate mannosyltransferase